MDKYIRIVPIFNQSAPGVWDTFTRIQYDTLAGVYSVNLAKSLCENALTEYVRDWKGAGAFAFGAYDDDKMVGFIRGNINHSSMYIAGVYVLPEFRGQRLGTRLLSAAERAGALATGYAELTALPGAESFYPLHGYSCSYSNVYIKQISKLGSNGVVPVFRLNSTLSRAARQILAPYDIKLQNHMPTFMYMGMDFRPMGIVTPKSDAFHNAALALADNVPSSMKNMVSDQLTRAIKPFIDR